MSEVSELTPREAVGDQEAREVDEDTNRVLRWVRKATADEDHYRTSLQWVQSEIGPDGRPVAAACDGFSLHVATLPGNLGWMRDHLWDLDDLHANDERVDPGNRGSDHNYTDWRTIRPSEPSSRGKVAEIKMDVKRLKQAIEDMEGEVTLRVHLTKTQMEDLRKRAISARPIEVTGSRGDSDMYALVMPTVVDSWSEGPDPDKHDTGWIPERPDHNYVMPFTEGEGDDSDS